MIIVLMNAQNKKKDCFKLLKVNYFKYIID
jgi:hypothetical protein